MTRVLVIGPGRVGRTLALAHRRAGDEVRLLGRRGGAWESWARAQGIESRVVTRVTDGDEAWWIFCLPDAELSPIARDSAATLGAHAEPTPASPSGPRLVLHTSGFHGLDVLEDFARHDRLTACVHPLLPFGEPKASLDLLENSLATILCEETARSEAEQVVRRWGCRCLPFEAKSDRRLYHLAASLASNHLMALLARAEDIARESLGEHARTVVHSLAAHAIEQVRTQGPAGALTGPAVRGDVDTLRAHFEALEPSAQRQYASDLGALMELVRESGRLSDEKRLALEALVDEWLGRHTARASDSSQP